MSDDNKPIIVKSHNVHLDADYTKWIYEVKSRYRNTQIKAAVKINYEQLLFNWELGRDLVLRKAEEKWGSGIVEQVSLDMRNEFPQALGFSTSNLWNMKKWYSFYARADRQKLQQLVGELWQAVKKPASIINFSKTSSQKLQQLVGELEFPDVFSLVPWGHHVAIITKSKSLEEAFFYLNRVIIEGWSRSALLNYIKADLFHTSGAAISNFSEQLPEAQSRLAQEITKDTYDLSFISLPPDYDEKSLEDALEHNITRFLLELGTGFAFVGRQKEIVVAGRSRKIDMLFYHIRLKCYVVVELKVVPFEPEFAGKLNYYVNAVNELIRTPDENPTIGLLICSAKNETEVHWAFQGIDTPIGVASYDNVKLENIKAQLPSAEEIQKRIKQAEEEYHMNKG